MTEDMHQSKDSHIIPMTSVSAGKGREVANDVFYFTDQIVNVIFYGAPGTDNWVLVDAGMPGSGNNILEAAAKRFSRTTPPKAILLTHGHFDHVGAITKLLKAWGNVPVYAHVEEFPFLTGELAYPEPDPTVEGGMLAKISSIYPNEPIDISAVIQRLPDEGMVPEMPGWKWLHTPGHSPGHISLYRETDGLLIAGDAFVTVEQDSFYKVLVQKKEVHGPPPYLTTDWAEAKESVRKLNALNPKIAITGHGTHMDGDELAKGLHRLAGNFDELAKPKYGRYVDDK